jgi:hypothetical protein
MSRDELALRPRAELLEEPAPATQALAPWRVERRDGMIVLGDGELHPVMARDLWMRLGQLLEATERDADQAEWARLSAELDRHFQGCPGVGGRTIGRPAMPVEGVLLREHEGVATLRLATFSIATLRRTKRGWEGPVYALRPTMVGHDRRPIGQQVRVPLEAVPEVRRLAIAGPAATLPPRSTTPPRRPEVPAWLRERWADIQAVHAEILACVPNVGDVVHFEALAEQLRIVRDVLRGHLETLVEQGELVELDPIAAGEPPRWQRVERVRFREGRRRTRVAAPKPARVAKAPKPPKKQAKAAPAADVLLRCGPCDRTVKVPAGTAIPAEPKCAKCGGLLARWVP